MQSGKVVNTVQWQGVVGVQSEHFVKVEISKETAFLFICTLPQLKMKHSGFFLLGNIL